MDSRFRALRDLLRRYTTVWRTAWSIRTQFDGPDRLNYERAFQPAHLELVETPVHPAPRWTARVVVALAILTLAVSVFGRLDIVVTAKGKLMPDARVKVIQPAITGVVRDIAVRDGDRVSAGQLLMKLDTTQVTADADKAKAARLDAALAAARAHALLDALNTPAALPSVATVADAPAERQQEMQRQVEGAWVEYRDRLASARAELVKRAAELDSTKAEIGKLEATVPLARSQADDYRALVGDQYVAKHDYQQKEQAALELEHELVAQRSHARELAASVSEQSAEIASLQSQFRREQLDALEKATESLTQNRGDETKAHTRETLMSLSAPVSGTVQQLAVHTLGGVVTTAQAVMEVVPNDALELEATIENRDIGFVKVGQRAAVKVEAFPYTRYGLLEGSVVSVANDAAQDKRQALVFKARIGLKTDRMRIDDRWIALTPGMAVTADIATGRQSVAQYFLGPLVQGVQESMHER
ncbi:HlyD family type I secretion periplasmic adaptor subunit [Paraburkholderia bengalensis]|uniref:Membrane fusion protein (MFP) family protein n=1 Tax=Paraburkholderia bengalensis TaxID=2747562 RepID=A0ABU8ITH0_9BURK